MDENKGYQEDSRSNEESNMPHLKEMISKENLLELGKKGISPFTQILHKYREEVSPFIEAIKTGCEAACKELSSEEAQKKSSSKVVCGWFEEVSTFLEDSNTKLNDNDPKVFISYVKEQSTRHPLLVFSSSYLLGLIAGRLSKRQYVDNKSRSLH